MTEIKGANKVFDMDGEYAAGEFQL